MCENVFETIQKLFKNMQSCNNILKKQRILLKNTQTQTKINQEMQQYKEQTANLANNV